MSASTLPRVRTIGGAALLLSATAIAAGQVHCDDSYCLAPENGAGTVDLPGACPLRSPDGSPIELVDGLPPQTSLRCDWRGDRFFDITTAPGGSLGGEVVTYQAVLHLDMHGTGQLTDFHRTLEVPLLMEVHTGPRTPGEPVQSFDTQIFMLQGAISGDPDFDLLSIAAGSNFGLPSPGHTTLTRIPSGDWTVDSFFDITYRIDFQGAPGSVLDGVSSSTTGNGPARNSSAPSSACVIPPGTGADLPAPCPYDSPTGLDILEGLPAGVTGRGDWTVDSFFDIAYQVGGQLGGGLVSGSAVCHLHIALDNGFTRDIDFPVTFLFDRSPNDDPTAPVVPIEMEMLQLHGQIFGDPDFDLLRVTAGSDFGMPSPGHTTLTRLPSSGSWAVDSFFDITYRIDFQGAPGSVLEGFGGATVSTSRLEQGLHNPPAPLHAFGLPNRPLGDACLSAPGSGGGGGGAGGSLLLENIGSSGEDGVSVDLGHADGFVVQLDQLGAGLPPGSSVCARAVGRDADGDGQGVYEVCFEEDGDGSVAFDLSVFGYVPEEIRSSARLGGTTVAEVVLHPPYPDALLTYGGGGGGGRIAVRSSCCDDDCDGLGDALRLVLRSSVPGEVQLSGGSLVLADSVLLCIDSDSDDDGVSDIDSLSSFDVRAAGVEQVSITGEALSLFGNPHASLGNARIQGTNAGSGSGGSVRIRSIGSSGQDGVSIDLREAPSFGGGGGGGRIALALASAPPNPPGTTLLRCTAMGMIDGAPGAISTMHLDGAGGAQSAIIGPTPWMAPESIRAELRLDGDLVLAADGLAPGAVATSFTPQVPGTYVFELVSPGGGGTGCSHTFVWSSSADMSLDGQPPVSANELRVIVTPAPLKGMTGADVELEGLQLHAAGMNELSITDEQTGPPPAPPCPADINASGVVDVDDLVALIVAWGSADPAADVNDDGVVNVDDLIEVILAWGPCGQTSKAESRKSKLGASKRSR